MEARRETTNREITCQVCCGPLAGRRWILADRPGPVLLESIPRPLQAYLGHSNIQNTTRCTAVTSLAAFGTSGGTRGVCAFSLLNKICEWSKYPPHSPSAGESTCIVEA